MQSRYDGQYFTKEYEAGQYAGATIWVQFRYDIKFNPITNTADFHFGLFSKASRRSVIAHKGSYKITMAGKSNTKSFTENIGTAYSFVPNSAMDIEGVTPNATSGKFATSVTFTYGTLTSTFNITDIVTIPQNVPTATATLSFYRAGETLNATIKYGSADVPINDGYFQIIGDKKTGKQTIYSQNNAEIIQDWLQFSGYEYGLIQGKTYNWELFVRLQNGRTKTTSGSIKIPATVSRVTIGNLSLNDASPVTALPYQLHSDNGATNFENAGVTFESDKPSVATIDAQGRITVHSDGYVSFTVTSKDTVEHNPSATKRFYIFPTSSFPFGTEAETTEWLSAPLTERLIDACYRVANKQGITIQTIPEFDGYTTMVRNTRAVINKINANVKKIADTKGITYDLVALTFSETNHNGEWYEMVNEWLRLMPLFKPYS